MHLLVVVRSFSDEAISTISKSEARNKLYYSEDARCGSEMQACKRAGWQAGKLASRQGKNYLPSLQGRGLRGG
jgi:hypothetical protein